MMRPFRKVVLSILGVGLVVALVLTTRETAIRDVGDPGAAVKPASTPDRLRPPEGDHPLSRYSLQPEDSPVVAIAGGEPPVISSPSSVALPMIDGKEPGARESEVMRMLIHAMHEQGMSLDVPADMSRDAWALLDSWIAPMLAERAKISDRSMSNLQQAAKSRYEHGLFEVHEVLPPSLVDEYRSWWHARDGRGHEVLHLVRIAKGQLGEVDYLAEQAYLIDRDMAKVARGFFDRFKR